MTLEIYENHCLPPQLLQEYLYNLYFLYLNFHSLKSIWMITWKSQENDHTIYCTPFYQRPDERKPLRGLSNGKLDPCSGDQQAFGGAWLPYLPNKSSLLIPHSASKAFKVQLFVNLFRHNLDLERDIFWKKWISVLLQPTQWTPIGQLAH